MVIAFEDLAEWYAIVFGGTRGQLLTNLGQRLVITRNVEGYLSTVKDRIVGAANCLKVV